MTRHPNPGLASWFVLGICLSVLGPDRLSTRAQQADDDRERQVMERFLGILESAPRRGTALDRVYGHHVERGTLDSLVKTYQERTANDPTDGASWLLLGLLESQRGRDAMAVAALRKAEETRSADAMPSYYLGQALVLVGQPDQAADAFERALARNPARADMLEIFQALGRVHQRARRNEQALAVWGRLEALFPDDARVQEQIASALAEESQLEPALARYEALAKKTRDPYRQVQFRTEGADLKVRLGRSADALRDFEGLLSGLEPGSWLYREVRRKIEDVFLRNDDQAGLAKYYEAWLAKTPDDVEAMARLGRTLAGQGRAADARVWFDKAVKLAPSRKELRLALVEQLVQDKKFADAAAQYEAMSKADPNNPDVVRDWGRLLLKDTSKPETERKQAAAAVWRKLVEAKPKDAATAAQVADLMRQAELADEAIALYKQAVALAPDSPQFREYLGEYYHTLKRSEDALTTRRAMAEGSSRNAKSLTRLGEVLSGFGYKKAAIATIAEACTLDAENFDLRVKHADLLLEAQRFDDADAQLERASALADDEDQRELVLTRRIANDQAAGRISARIEALKKELATDKANDASAWRRLARYSEAARQPAEAVTAIEKAVALDEKAIPSLSTAARLYESSGRFGEAADVYRKLAALDRRARTEYLTNIAKLEARLGRKDEALKAGRDLLAAAPGNPEHFQFFSDLCFQLGENEEGLETLRRAARANESDTKALLNLAEALAREFRTEEAIELFWRAFDRTNDLDPKLGVISRLADLYLQRNQFDRLTARLERLQREENRQREATLCLAQAHAASGDFGTARQQLENLLAANARDTALLQQLSSLAENEGDVAAAAKYQKQLVDVAPGDENATRLAQLYLRAGDIADAETVWARFTSGGQDQARVLGAVDSLLTHGKYDSVLATTERLLRDEPTNWEALYREARALAALDKNAEAAKKFQALLDLRRNDDEESAIVKARKKGGGASNTARALGTAAARSPVVMQPFPARDRLNAASQVRYWLGLMPGVVMSQANAWNPADFGQARIAAVAWLFTQAQRENAQDDFLAKLRGDREKSPNDPRPVWDWYHLQYVRQENKELYEAGKALARVSGRDPAAHWAFLGTLNNRAIVSGVRVVRAQGADEVDKTPPLPADEIDLMLASYRTLQRLKPDLASFMTPVSTELKRAKRTDEADALYRELVASAGSLSAAANACLFAAERGDVEGLLKLFDAFDRLQGTSRSTSGPQGYVMTPQGYIQAPSYAFAIAMRLRADAKAHGDVLRLLDRYLAYLSSPSQVAQRTRAQKNSSAQNMGMAGYRIYLAKNPRYINVDYPNPDAYLDHSAILLLRNAFELFKRDDLASDLLAHLKKPLDAKENLNPADALYAHLELSALKWWSDEKDEALKELAQAVELVPSDSDLKLNLAELQSQRQDPDEGLALVESVESVDQKVTQRRELLALRLAVQTGQVERARKAAERLFGLRLDSNTQVQLAQQMHQLGMHDLAEAVLARARRRAGNNSAVLVSLMGQYQRRGKTDIAEQVAHQILRRAPVQRSNIYQDVEDPSHVQAIQVLARSGKLKEMIERVEAQVERSPQSLQLQQSLASYYKAAGQRDKLKSVYETIAKLRPDDARLRFQLATQLVQSGDPAAGLEHYRAALKKEPALFGYRFYEVQNAFQQANKMDELVKLFEEIDMKSLGNWNTVANLIQNLVQNPKTIDQAMTLLRKAWNAFPNERSYFVARLYNDEIWKRAELYEYAREAVIPGPAMTQISPWYGIDQITSWGSEGRVTAVATRLLDAAARQNKLESLAKEIETALARTPEWLAGNALLGVIRVKQGKVDDGKKILQAWLDDPTVKPPSEARVIIGQEIENHVATQPIAVALYEKSLKENAGQNNSGMGFQYGPVQRLARLHRRAGRADEGRTLILQAARKDDGNYANYDPQYAAYQRLNDLNAIGAILLEIGYPADAARVYNEILGSSDLIQSAQPYYGNNDYMLQQARSGIDRSLQGLTKESLAPTLKTLLEPQPGRKDEPLDLVLMVYPRELDKAAVTSLFSSALDMAATKPELLAEVKSGMEGVVKDHPTDLPALTAAALVECAGADPKAIAEVADRLERLATEAPLETLSEGVRPNARQRVEAARRMGLWLVARACWKHSASREAGDRLAALGLEAARRQGDNVWTLAMLREWGQSALDRGDSKTAEARWSSMLDLILVNPTASKPKDPKKPAAAPAPTPAPAKAKKASLRQGGTDRRDTPRAVAWRQVSRLKPVAEQIPAAPALPPLPAPSGAMLSIQPSTPAGRPGGPVTTPERFGQAAQVARLAAENGMIDLSLRAVREALKGGPPVVPVAMPANSQRMIVRGGPFDESGQDPTLRDVEQRLSGLDALWQRRKAPPGAVYEVLRDVVIPATRPNEVFLYAGPLINNMIMSNMQERLNAIRPRSVGVMLARWAVAAGQADDLRKRLAARQAQPMAELPALVLLCQLAQAEGKSEAIVATLGALGKRLEKDSLQTSAELVCHAALPALNLKEAEPVRAAVSIVESAAKSFGNSNVEEPAGTILITLARFQFEHGDVAAGRKQLEEYIASSDRNTARYAGNVDYQLSRRKIGYATAASEYLRARQWADALEMLGQAADIVPSRYQQVSLDGPVAALARQAAASTPGELYDRLEKWTLPTATRKSVRLLGAFAATTSPPAVFGVPALPPMSTSGVVDSASLLIAAARAEGKLDALAVALRPLAEQNLENARSLQILVEIARGRGAVVEATAKTFAAELSKKVPLKEAVTGPVYNPTTNVVPAWPDVLVARACLADAALGTLGETMAEDLVNHAKRTSSVDFEGFLRRDLASAKARRATGEPAGMDRDPGLALRQLASTAGVGARAAGAGGWVAHEGHILHLGGGQSEHLQFAYPLVGTFSFSFSVDAFIGDGLLPGLVYGGTVLYPSLPTYPGQPLQTNGQIMSIGATEVLARPSPFVRREAFNRLTVRAEPGKVGFFVNGHLFYETTQTTTTTPWLELVGGWMVHTLFRNPRLTGQPTIPREVCLVADDRLDGWVSSFYNETQPARRRLREGHSPRGKSRPLSNTTPTPMPGPPTSATGRRKTARSSAAGSTGLLRRVSTRVASTTTGRSRIVKPSPTNSSMNPTRSSSTPRSAGLLSSSSLKVFASTG